MTLKAYERKRIFRRTPEPRPGRLRSRRTPIFVVQQHDATTMHYDFRLEVAGALKSWAIPKGPSMDPKVKRLAVPTEDHPIDYATFEGVIPEGQYGAGPVIVWDRGSYENTTGHPPNGVVDPENALRHGHFVFNLKGKKLNGRFVLQRVGSGDKRWFLIKARDEYASRSRELVSARPESVLSGKTVRDLRSVDPRD